MSRKKPFSPALEVAGAITFGALSVVVSFSAAFIPRLPWGIALIDLISIVWIGCFLVFGIRSAIACCCIGTIALMFFDPFAPIGPFMKLLATLPMILIPYLFLKLNEWRKNIPISGQDLASKKFWFSAGVVATLVRIAIMIPIVVVVVHALFGTPIMEIIIFTLLLNVVQSVWDIVLPWFVVYPTGIYENYGSYIW